LSLAIVCAALYTVVKKGGGKAMQRMQYSTLLEEVSFLSSLLKLDMIYKPGGIEHNTQRTVQWLVENHVIEVDEEGWVGLADIERQCGRENYGRRHAYRMAWILTTFLLYRLPMLYDLALR
jgi:hypothetical protein